MALSQGDTGITGEDGDENTTTVTDGRLDTGTIITDRTGRLGSLDAFGRQRVSQPFALFDSKQIYDDGVPIYFVTDFANGGTATYVQARAATDLKTTTTSGSRAIRQTRRYFNYQAGKSFFHLLTYNFDAEETNVRKRVGFFDADDGIFVQLSGSALSMNLRSNVTGTPVDTSVAQASWNLDTLDGSGNAGNPSGILLDNTRTQILVIDLQYLGVGAVRTGFDIDGNIIYCHQFLNANIGTTVYMSTPNLPLRWEIENIGVATGTPSMQAICGTVMVEGGREQVGVTRSAGRGVSNTTITNTLEQLIAIRLTASHNRATVIPKKSVVMSSTGANFHWVLVFNPSITGGAASWTSIPNSAVEFDVTRNGAVTGGTVIDEGYASNNADLAIASLESILTLASDFSGAPDELVLAAQKVGGGSEQMFGSLTWLEAA